VLRRRETRAFERGGQQFPWRFVVIKALFAGNVSLMWTLSSFLDTLYVERASGTSIFCWVTQMTSTNWYIPIGVCTYDGYFVAGVA
jgi:hypothetical protein